MHKCGVVVSCSIYATCVSSKFWSRALVVGLSLRNHQLERVYYFAIQFNMYRQTKRNQCRTESTTFGYHYFICKCPWRLIVKQILVCLFQNIYIYRIPRLSWGVYHCRCAFIPIANTSRSKDSSYYKRINVALRCVVYIWFGGGVYIRLRSVCNGFGCGEFQRNFRIVWRKL